MFLRVVAALGLAAALLTPMSASSQEPAHFTYSPAPPGTIVQSQLLYLTGQAMHSQWRGVVSRKLVGASGAFKFYQYYLSLYSINQNVYQLRYQSPKNGGPVDLVKKVDSSMWFPMQTMAVVGVGQFQIPTVENLVVTSHQTGADCGAAQITIFGYNTTTNKVVEKAVITNGCDLNAKVVQSADGLAWMQLTGPYYNATAPMCCPTKNKATATLRYKNGKWIESPNYFKLGTH